MESFQKKVFEATEFIKERSATAPAIGLLAGTGLGSSVKGIQQAVTLDYKDIPHFPVSTVTSHRGRLLFVSHAERGHDRIRIISARKATRNERKYYEEHDK